MLTEPAISGPQEPGVLAPQELKVAPGTQPLTAFSPNGEFYAVATPDGRIRCGGTRDGSVVRTLYQCHPRTLVFSPDSRLLAAAGGCGGSPNRLKVWHVADGRLLCRVETGAGRDPLLSFSPDSTLLASTGDGIRINFWHMPSGTFQGSFTTGRFPSRLTFSGEGKAVIALSGDGGIQRFPLP